MAKQSQIDRVIAKIRGEITDRERMLELLTAPATEGKVTRAIRGGRRGGKSADQGNSSTDE